MSKDVFLDIDGNIERETGGLRLVEGPVATEVRLRIAINWQLEEAPVNLDQGIDYISVFSQKPPDTSLIASQIRDVVLEDPAVTNVESIDVDFDRENRSITYTIQGTVDGDEELHIKGTLNQ